MKISLKSRLERYLRKGHGWVSSIDLQRIVMEKTNNTPRTAVRRLEELAEEGKLEVRYVRGAAQYRAVKKVTAEEWFEQLPSITLP